MTINYASVEFVAGVLNVLGEIHGKRSIKDVNDFLEFQKALADAEFIYRDKFAYIREENENG